MGSSKFHTLRRLVSPARHQQLHDDPSDELAMVGRSEVPVCLAADRPPAHLLQSLYSRDATAASSTSTSASTSTNKRPPPPPQPLTPPRSPPRPGAATANCASGSPVTAAPPDSPLSGYRRSPVPEPIMEVDELEEEGEEEPPRPADAAAPPPTARASSRPRWSLESIPETPTPLAED